MVVPSVKVAVLATPVPPLPGTRVALNPAAVPVVFWFRGGKLVIFAALIVGAVWKDGAAAPPEAGPAKTEFCAAVDSANVSAGVLVAVATEVVKSGERFPALKDVTVPVPAEGATQVPLCGL